MLENKPEYLSCLNRAVGKEVPVKEKTLKIYYLDEENNFWVSLNSDLDSSANMITADLKHFSVYTIMGGPNYDIDAHPFPVPYKPSERPPDFEDKPTKGSLIFTGLPSECTIKIYTIAGRLVNTLRHSDSKIKDPEHPGNYYWYPVENSQGNKVTSGVYIYYIETTDSPKTKTGKLMIIR